MFNKKKISVLSMLAACGVVAVGGLTGCGGDGGDVVPPKPTPVETKYGGTATFNSPYFEGYFALTTESGEDLLTTSKMTLVESGKTGVKAYAYEAPAGAIISWEVQNEKGEVVTDLSIASDGTVTVPTVTSKKEYTVYCIATDPDNEDTKIRAAFQVTVVPTGSIATGTQDLMGLTNEELLSTFSGAESLALETGLAGMNFWAYGGYVQINNRVVNSRSEDGKFTSSSYVPGYGFGIGTYGYLNADNPTESNSSWKRYYHSENSNQTTTVNKYKSSGTGVSDYWSLFNAPYFETMLSEEDESEYVASMATTAEPIPLDDNGNELTGTAANGLHSKWKVKVNVGSKVKYRNLGTKNGSAFDGREVALEDYLTPYIMYYTQAAQASNVTQMLGTFVGDSAYYKKTAEVDTVTVDYFLENFPGIQLNRADNSLIFELETPCTSDFAAYRLNNQGVLPLTFVQDTLGGGSLSAGVTKYGTVDEKDGSNPEDNVLSTGPYVLEKVSEDKIVLKKNDQWYVTKDGAGRDVYKLEGYVYTKNTALQQDTDLTLAFKQFEEGYTEQATIPSSKIADLKNDPLTIHIENTGEKNGVSFNCLNKIDYDYLFGTGTKFQAHAIAGQFFSDFELGSAGNSSYRTTYFDNDWTVKPIMGNHNFQKGLNCGYNRNSFAETLGRVGFSDYYGDINKMTPKSSSRYNETDAHKNAVKSVYGEDGISLSSNEKGIQYFKEALTEELEAGHYLLGTASKPTEITINVNWQSSSWINFQGTAIFGAIEDTFTTAVLSNSSWCDGSSPLIKLKFEQTSEGSGQSDYINAYVKVALGQYDIAQASISGGEYEVFQETGLWESYNRAYSLTIHHALVTNIPSSYITYNGKYYSLDALYYGNTETVSLDGNGRIDYSSLRPVA